MELYPISSSTRFHIPLKEVPKTQEAHGQLTARLTPALIF